MAAYLFHESFMYLLITQDTLLLNKNSIAQNFILDQYAETVFQSIMSDTGVTKVSIAGKSQFKALEHKMPKIEPDTTHANKATIYFGSELPLSSIGIVQIIISISTANFHDINTPIFFLFYLKDMDTLGIYLNNITNQLICQNGKNIPIFCK